jgi:hypothetical protein
VLSTVQARNCSAALGNCGSIVVYHQQFETQRLSELAPWLPEFAGRIERLNRRDAPDVSRADFAFA